MYRLIILILATMFVVSCQKNDSKNEVTRFHEDGRAKPVVTLAPVIDSANYDVAWSMSEEFSSLLQKKMQRKGEIFLTACDESDCSFDYTQNFFGHDLSSLKQTYPQSEFVIFAELVEHVNIPTAKDSNQKIREAEKLKGIASNLNMGIRVRVVDLRKNEPKIVLQELITDSYYISKNHMDTDYTHLLWGMDEYDTSPMGLAHNQLVKTTVERINEYILLAKSR